MAAFFAGGSRTLVCPFRAELKEEPPQSAYRIFSSWFAKPLLLIDQPSSDFCMKNCYL